MLGAPEGFARSAWVWPIAAVVALAGVSSCAASQLNSTPASPDIKESSSSVAPVSQSAEADPHAAAPVSALKVPKDCDHKNAAGICLPANDFVKVLCNGVYADVALVMFQGGTPWARAYLTRKTDAWNASGGASVQGQLAFDEEVLILRERSPQDQGIQVSGAMGSYDALRWNGSCVSLMTEEVTFRKPPKLLYSRVEWNWLGEPMRESLRKDPEVLATYRARRNECKGVSMGDVSKKCEQLDGKLIELIVQHVRSGGELGDPKFP